MREWVVVLVALVVESCAPAAMPAAKTPRIEYGGVNYASKSEALAAQQRDLDRIWGTVPAAESPIPASVLIVVPSANQLNLIVASAISLSPDAHAKTPANVSYNDELLHQQLVAVRDSLLRARLFRTAVTDERNDTAAPPIGTYDYVIWYQVEPPRGSSVWTGRWMAQKRGRPTPVAIATAPNLPPAKYAVGFLEAVQRAVHTLDAGTATAATPPTTIATAPASAAPPALTVEYDGQKYGSGPEFITALQRQHERELAALAAAATPLPGRATIILSTRKSLPAQPLIPPGSISDIMLEADLAGAHARADAIAKGRLFTAATIVSRDDASPPPASGSEYVLWHEPAKGLGWGKWSLARPGATGLQPISFPVPPGAPLSAWVEAVRLSAQGLPAPSSAAAGGAIKFNFTVAAPRATGALGPTSSGPASGTGIAIAPGGYLVTNAHVVRACREVRVVDRDGAKVPAEVKTQDADNDLALVTVPRHWSAVAQLRDGAPIRAGDSVVALGFPLVGLLASEANVTTGTISALAGVRNDSRYYQLTAPVQPGNSGGPLLDENGRLVGVVSTKLNALAVASRTGDIPQNINFAIKDSVLRNFLDANAVPYALSQKKPRLTPADIGERGKAFTFLIECSR